jgi:SAM-dependent methyltransferase
MTDVDRVREQVASFPTWHYEFDLNGVRTPVFRREHVNRHEQRKMYFFAPLVQVCGGSLSGKRVLDLGCNAGFWSLQAIEAHADFVLGVDGRQMHVDQANLVFEVKGVDPNRYRFETSDIFELDLSPENRFDIVLCLGLFYHVSKPVELMERISRWNTDLVIIDTALDKDKRVCFRMRRENLDCPRAAADRGIALVPSREAVVRLASEFDYRDVKILVPRFTNWEGCGAYRAGTRRAFFCAKRTALDGLDAEPLEGLLRPPRPSCAETIIRKAEDNGTLSHGEAHSLLTKLTRAKRWATAGKPQRSRQKLTAFIRQVKAMVRSHRVLPEFGQRLVHCAEGEIAQLLPVVTEMPTAVDNGPAAHRGSCSGRS